MSSGKTRRGVRALGVLSGAFLGLSAAAVIWEWVAAAATESFFRKARKEEKELGEAPVNLPAASVLLPLKGASSINRRSLESVLEQEYPEFEVIVGIEPADSAATALLQELQRETGGERLRLAPGENTRGGRSQASNIYNALQASQFPLLVIMDADIAAGKDFLQHFLRPLLQPGIGMTTCLYREGTNGSLGSILDGLWTSTSYLPSALFGRHVIGESFAFGAARSIRRDVLEAIGGFEAVDPTGMDDYQLGQLTAEAGFKVQFVPYIVTELLPRLTLAQLINRRVRWFRNIRILRPLGYTGFLVTQGIPLALFAVLLRPSRRAGWGWLTLVLINRLVCAGLNRRFLDSEAPPWELALVPLRDVVGLLVWVLGFTRAKNPLHRMKR